MKIPVYKSLDKTSSLFGIRGSYLYVMIGGVLIAVVVGFGIIGSVLGSVFGTVATLIIGAVAYFIVMMLQSKYSERQLTKRIQSSQLPDYVLLQTGCLARPLRGLKYEDLRKTQKE